MKYALWITGIPAVLALAFPKLVAIAYFFLILPGVILTIAPTVFVYLAGAALLRRLIPLGSRATATALSFVLMLVFGWAVMQPFRAASIAAYENSNQADITPAGCLVLHGRVLIEAPDSRSEAACDYLCLAALDSPAVRSVTMVTGGRDENRPVRSAAYALQSAKVDSSVGQFPQDPGQIVREYRPLVRFVRGTDLRVAAKAVEAGWALRLSGPERLRSVNPVTPTEADWVIRIDRLNLPARAKLQRITVSDATGTVRFRKSYRSQSVPAGMFYYGFEAFSAGGPISRASFHVGRQYLTTGSASLHPESEFLKAIGYQVPECDITIVDRLRSAAEHAVSDAAASDAKLDSARRYLGLIHFDSKESDHGLIAAIVADDRVQDIDEQLMRVFSKEKTPVAVKDAYAERITMPHTSTKLRRWLADSLSELPAGTFSAPTAVHLSIWNSPGDYPGAGPFFSRTADLGAARALPILRAALHRAAAIPAWSDRRPLIEGIRDAFIQLGPTAYVVTPELTELFLRRPSPILHDSGDADDWRFALARMGMDIRDLPFFPGQSEAMVQRITDKVTRRIRRYEQNLNAEANR